VQRAVEGATETSLLNEIQRNRRKEVDRFCEHVGKGEKDIQCAVRIT
jgi:hypothetical protein